MQGHDVQSVEKVLAEIRLCDLVFQVPVGCGDDTDVQINRANASNAQDTPLLYDMKELYLHGGGHLADLSRNTVPPDADSSKPIFVAPAPVNDPFSVAEKLAADEFFSESAAVETDKRMVLTGAQLVDRPRHQRFAGAACAWSKMLQSTGATF